MTLNQQICCSVLGWAATALFNNSAKTELMAFYSRPDTFSLGVCNGCQLMAMLGWVGSNKSGESDVYTLYTDIMREINVFSATLNKTFPSFLNFNISCESISDYESHNDMILNLQMIN